VEAGGSLGGDEIPPELSLPESSLNAVQRLFMSTESPGSGHRSMSVPKGLGRSLLQFIRGLLKRLHLRPERGFSCTMAARTGGMDIPYGACDPMVRKPRRPFGNVWHVAIDARDAPDRMDAFPPQCMLRAKDLDQGRS
jgi:hypothetical protein